MYDRYNGEKINDNKDDAQKHAQKEQAESWRHSDDLKRFEVVAIFDVPE